MHFFGQIKRRQVIVMNNTEKIKKRYDRISSVYDFFEAPMERMAMSKWRAELMNELSGKVLEVGVGTGKNIEFYPDNMDITAIDFSPKMIERAKNKSLLLHKKVEFLLMDVESLDFPDNTFDTVFTTCVFCSVPDPVKGLKEIRRVCKPDGKIILLEHMRSERKYIGLIMDFFNPLVVRTYGANINRRTVENVTSAGFHNFDTVNLFSDIVKKINITNEK